MATKASKLPSGKWRIRVQVDTNDGLRHYRSFTAPTKKEAELMAASFLANGEKHNFSAMTVGDAVDKYIDLRDAILSPATVLAYKEVRRTAFLDIYDVRLNALTNDKLQRSINRYAANHSPKTIKNQFAVVRSAIEAELPEFRLNVYLPKMAKTEMTIPAPEDVAALIDASKGTMLENAILLAAGYGMRRGEICALTYNDIDKRNCTISISKTKVEGPAGKMVVKSPKTYSGTRTIIVSKELIARLEANRHDPILVCPLLPESLTAEFCKLRNELGFSFRFHDLRHYCASVMLANDIPDKYAMEILGQSTNSVLRDVYQHIIDSKRHDVAETMRRSFESVTRMCHDEK